MNNWMVLSYGTKLNKNFAVGINLRWVQDANTPPTLGCGNMIRNVRPGIAYRPDDRTVLAMDAYNAVPDAGDHTEWSVGAECCIGSHLRVRIGNYHKTWTYGLGVKVNKNMELNVAHLAGPDWGIRR